MTQVLECVMLICFGLSWPISVYKSIVSRSTQGKSVVFIVAIILGYIAGITAKIISGTLNYVLALYIFNLAVVSVDLVIYFVNRHRERKADLKQAPSQTQTNERINLNKGVQQYEYAN